MSFKVPTDADIAALLTQTAGDLRPWEIELIQDWLHRRPYNRGNPSQDPTSQPTLTTIAS